ncbi:hypothetical protein M885DRAFT_616389, partial [Pelagophyceae sp. CCMP2097]
MRFRALAWLRLATYAAAETGPAACLPRCGEDAASAAYADCLRAVRHQVDRGRAVDQGRAAPREAKEMNPAPTPAPTPEGAALDEPK